MNSSIQCEKIYDVIVVGGGLAGTMAAIGAAREGVKVLLIEKYGFLGGMATSALVNPFMNYWERNAQGNQRKMTSGGLFAEMLDRLCDIGGMNMEDGRAFNEQMMKIVLDRMVSDYHVDVLFHALLSSVQVKDRIIKSITVSTISGNIDLQANTFIDATGNGDLAAFAGCDYKLGRAADGLCQPMTTCFRIGHVDWEKYDRQAVNKLYNEFQEQGKIKNIRENILVFRYPVDDIMHLNTTRIVKLDPTNVFDLTKAETSAREQVFEMYQFLKENAAGMENSVLLEIATEIGVRESRRIVGYYEITENDLLSTIKFEDSIARGTYSIDIHNPSGTGTVIKNIPENDYYTIPYRAIVPTKVDNLLVAGRPISSTHEAHSSFRIMPITTCIGEAAGIASANAVKDECKMSQINIKNIHKSLDNFGGLY